MEGWDAGFGDDVLSGQACDLLAPCTCESDDQRQPVERILDQDITGSRARPALKQPRQTEIAKMRSRSLRLIEALLSCSSWETVSRRSRVSSIGSSAITPCSQFATLVLVQIHLCALARYRWQCPAGQSVVVGAFYRDAGLRQMEACACAPGSVFQLIADYCFTSLSRHVRRQALHSHLVQYLFNFRYHDDGQPARCPRASGPEQDLEVRCD